MSHLRENYLHFYGARIALLFVAVFLASTTVFAGREVDLRPEFINFHLYSGLHQFDADDWAPLDEVSTLGFSATYKPFHWAASPTFAYFSSSDSAEEGIFTVKAEVEELQIGLRKFFPHWAVPDLYPSLALGFSYAKYTTHVEGEAPLDATGLGGWAGAGAHYLLGGKVAVGVDARYSYVPADKKGEVINVGGLFVGVTLGYHWKDIWW